MKEQVELMASAGHSLEVGAWMGQKGTPRLGVGGAWADANAAGKVESTNKVRTPLQAKASHLPQPTSKGTTTLQLNTRKYPDLGQLPRARLVHRVPP